MRTDPSALTGALNELGLKKFLARRFAHLCWEVTANWSEDDMIGIDVVGRDALGRPVYFAQAKSSLYGAMNFGTGRMAKGLLIHVWYVDEEGEWVEYV